MNAPDPMAAALAELIAKGGGVRRIAKAHGVSPEPLRQRWEAAKGNRPPVDLVKSAQHTAKARARAPAPAREAESTGDLVGLSAVGRLEAELRECRTMMASAQTAGHHNVWKDLAKHEHVLGLALDKARHDDRTERAARDAAELRDPAALARVVLSQVPWLAQLAPVEAREVWTALGVALGEVDDHSSPPSSSGTDDESRR